MAALHLGNLQGSATNQLPKQLRLRRKEISAHTRFAQQISFD